MLLKYFANFTKVTSFNSSPLCLHKKCNIFRKNKFATKKIRRSATIHCQLFPENSKRLHISKRRTRLMAKFCKKVKKKIKMGIDIDKIGVYNLVNRLSKPVLSMFL